MAASKDVEILLSTPVLGQVQDARNTGIFPCQRG